jgi:molybdopterin synthase catalytic subunit
MNLTDLVERVKQHPDFRKAGMVLCHNGVVRETPGSGGQTPGSGGGLVDHLVVKVDHAKLAEVVARHKRMPGIIEILAEIAEGRKLSVGDDIMMLVVAGDVRTNVIPVMTSLIDEIKATVTGKTEVRRND